MHKSSASVPGDPALSLQPPQAPSHALLRHDAVSRPLALNKSLALRFVATGAGLLVNKLLEVLVLLVAAVVLDSASAAVKAVLMKVVAKASILKSDAAFVGFLSVFSNAAWSMVCAIGTRARMVATSMMMSLYAEGYVRRYEHGQEQEERSG